MTGKRRVKPYREKKFTHILYLRPDSVEQLQQLAEQLGVSFSTVIETAILEYLQEIRQKGQDFKEGEL